MPFILPRYPGKLCALCNLSERSTLGQGDMIKLKLSEDLDFSTLEDKRKSSGSESPSGSHGGISASPKSLNSRRKNRKLTSGEATEPLSDELDQVGFVEDPDLNLLFETSGQCSKICQLQSFLLYQLASTGWGRRISIEPFLHCSQTRQCGGH